MKKADFLRIVSDLERVGFDFSADFSQLSPSKVEILSAVAAAYNFTGNTPVSTERLLYEKLQRLSKEATVSRKTSNIKTLLIENSILFQYDTCDGKNYGFVEANPRTAKYVFGAIGVNGFTYAEGNFDDFLDYFGFEEFPETVMPWNDRQNKNSFVLLVEIVNFFEAKK